ncbi:NmrA family NAD(P)-binding protein [Spirillospora sp. NPDC029432]|uniref:NAD(P)H-binding protein n=1 Tax=Spirillospora sp. NPDC029432 TaxID=3154599 RepID=UPI00345617FE
MILVTGATGTVGRPLVERLAAAGHKVRALSRTPATARMPAGVEVAPTADLPLDGITSIFVNPAAFWTGLGDLLPRAAGHGVRRVVLLSSLAAADEDDPDNTIGLHHLEVEREIEASGLEWTFVRPGAFASNTLSWAAQIRATGTVSGAYARAQFAPIHEADIAAVAFEALTTDTLIGARPLLTGPESLSQSDQARLIGEAIGRPVRYEEISPEAAVEAMTAEHIPPAVAESLIRIQADSVDRPADISPEVERITGSPARTYAQWATDHTTDFQ